MPLASPTPLARWPVTVTTQAGDFAVGPVVVSDAEAFVSYWHDGIADLDYLGIDPAKLGTPADTRARFAVFAAGSRPREAFGFRIAAQDRPVGFINVNVFGRARGIPHFHLTDPSVRRSGLMTAVLSACLEPIMNDVYEQSGADGLTVEIRTRNAGMNAVLHKLGHRVMATRELENPDGLAGPGTFNIYQIDRAAAV